MKATIVNVARTDQTVSMKVKGVLRFTLPGVQAAISLTTASILFLHAAEPPRPFWSNEITFNRGHQTAICLDPTGNPIHLWSSETNAFVSKFAAGGALLWQKELHANLRILELDPEGNPIVSGRIKVIVDDKEQSDAVIAKLSNASGDPLWEKRYREDRKFLDSIDLSLDGNDPITLSSPAVLPVSNSVAVLTKFDGLNGATLWQKQFSNVTVYAHFAIGTNGTIAIQVKSPSAFQLSKLSSTTGNEIWAVTHPSTIVDYWGEMLIDGAGNLFITGSDYPPSYPNGRILTAKFAATTGKLMWQKTVPPPFNSSRSATYGHRLLALPNSDILALGMLGPDKPGEANTPYIIRYSTENGEELWAKRFPFSGSPLAPMDSYPHLTRLILDEADENIVFGVATAFYTGSSSLSSTFKFAPANGDLLWQLTHTNLNYPNIDYRPDLLVLAGVARSNNASIATLFRGGPELSIAPASATELDISWSTAYMGWALQRLSPVASLTPRKWNVVPGSTNTTTVRISSSLDDSEMFQLIRYP